MPKSRQQKKADIDTLVDHLGRMKSVIFTSYDGLTVPEVTELRKTLRNEGVEHAVVKKTLFTRALEAAGMTGVSVKEFEGGIAASFGFTDEVLPAKLLKDFQKTHEAVVFRGGIIQGKLMSAAEVQALAKLPSKQELLAQLIGSLAAPMSRFVSVSSGPMRGFARVLAAKSEAAS